MALASGMPSMTRSWTCFHLAAAAGAEASLQRMTKARLNGTPAASKLESRRVKFSSMRAETLVALPNESLRDRVGAFVLSAGASLGGGLGGGFFSSLTPFRLARR